MYPLNVSLPAPAVGFAVANDADEHARLTEAGYLPALLAAQGSTTDETSTDEATELADVKAKLDALGVEYHHSTGLKKLKALLAAQG